LLTRTRSHTVTGAEIAARISNELFEYLDAPVRRVGATDTFIAYAPQVENIILPHSEDVEKAFQELIKYEWTDQTKRAGPTAQFELRGCFH